MSLPPHLLKNNMTVINISHVQTEKTSSSNNIQAVTSNIQKKEEKQLGITHMRKLSGKNKQNNLPKSERRIRKLKHSKILRKKWKVVRKAGGEIWEDPSLDEWPENDYRIFCGDLGNEVTDEILTNAFRKYSSFNKARVVRDKRTSKSKGYGFISIGDAGDYIKAMREMNGKYVGNRPIRLKRSTWKDRCLINSNSKVDIVRFKKNKPRINKKMLMNNTMKVMNTINNFQPMSGQQIYQSYDTINYNQIQINQMSQVSQMPNSYGNFLMN
jgi:RNA recognition motif-containing protein